jgi:hypothetical protein
LRLLPQITLLPARLIRLLIHPFSLLALHAVVVLLCLHYSGQLKPTKVPDTISYMGASRATSASQALSHYRTYGYPLFLQTVRSSGRSLADVPLFHALAFLSATLFFWLALSVYLRSPWMAFAATLPMPYTGVWTLARRIQPDFLAAATTVLAFSFLLLLAVKPKKVALWVGLALAVFMTYQLRPAALFLIVLVPLLGGLLRSCVDRPSAKVLLRWTVGLAATTLLPYLMFAGLRWQMLGHFGLVPFGSTNLAGLTASFLDRALIAELPREHRKVAETMLKRREKRGWEPLKLDSDSEPFFRQYSDNIWKVALPAARIHVKRQRKEAAEKGGAPADPRGFRVVVNETLGGLSRELVRLRPMLYLKWVRDALRYGLDQLFDDLVVLWLLILIASALPIGWLREGFRSGEGRETEAIRGNAEPELSRLLGFMALGVIYFVTYLLLVCLVSLPYQRYLVSMTLFLPSVLSAELFAVWQRILRPQPTRTAAVGSPSSR